MRETSLYCRPDVVCAVWFAMQTCTSGVLVFAKDKHGKALGPYEILYLDSDQQLGITDQGLVILLPPENAMANSKDKATAELAQLLATPRRIRKPDNYIHPDECPELRRLLSKRYQLMPIRITRGRRLRLTHAVKLIIASAPMNQRSDIVLLRNRKAVRQIMRKLLSIREQK